MAKKEIEIRYDKNGRDENAVMMIEITSYVEGEYTVVVFRRNLLPTGLSWKYHKTLYPENPKEKIILENWVEVFKENGKIVSELHSPDNYDKFVYEW